MSENYKIRDKDRAYYLTLTVVGWIDLFTKPNHKLFIVESLRCCQKQKGLELYGYCIMSNHIHLIARAKGKYTLSEILRDFKNLHPKN